MSGTGWQGADLELYNEALRVIPAAAKARIEGNVMTMSLLLDGYRDDARRLGVPESRWWLIFSTASIAWVSRTIHRDAHARDETPLAAADRAIRAAAAWAADGG